MMIAIYGAGSIGTAWAIVFGHAGHDVSVYDPDVTRLNTAGQEIESRLEQLAEFDLIESPAADIVARIAFVSSPQRALSAAEYVQECAPENLELKQEIFRDLERMCRPEAVLASSSSALTATKFAEDLPSRSRCLVVHPGNPPYLIRVVEVVPAPFTDQAVVERTGELLRQAGMAPVILRRELEGFVFNRLQGALLREAYCLVRDGVISANELDDLVRHGLGFRWSAIGPFETAELNTRGGIEAHAKKMGPSYARMGAERGQNDPWTDELVSKVKEERRKRMPLAEWDKRVEWRDRVLMQLLRHRHQIGLKIDAPLQCPRRAKIRCAMTAETIIRDTPAPGIAEVRLNRPECLNAVDESVIDALTSALRDTARDKDTRVVILSGEGRAFCAGADYKRHAVRPAAERPEYLRRLLNVCREIYVHPKPVIAAVHGFAIGMGAEMAINCDFLVMTEDAFVRLPEVSIGSFVGGGVTHILPRLVGIGRAREMLLMSKSVPALEAKAIGLATDVIAGSSFRAGVLAFAKQLADQAPVSIRLGKRTLNSSGGATYDVGFQAEHDAVLTCMGTSDWREGVQAFAAKRAPKFTGE